MLARECRAFDLDANFFALQVYPDSSAKLRMQRGGADFALADGLVLQIEDTRRLRGRLGEPVPIGNNENIRAGLGLFARCPGSVQNFDITGSIVFESFGLDKETELRASSKHWKFEMGAVKALEAFSVSCMGISISMFKLGRPISAFRNERAFSSS